MGPGEGAAAAAAAIGAAAAASSADAKPTATGDERGNMAAAAVEVSPSMNDDTLGPLLVPAGDAAATTGGEQEQRQDREYELAVAKARAAVAKARAAIAEAVKAVQELAAALPPLPIPQEHAAAAGGEEEREQGKRKGGDAEWLPSATLAVRVLAELAGPDVRNSLDALLTQQRGRAESGDGDFPALELDELFAARGGGHRRQLQQSHFMMMMEMLALSGPAMPLILLLFLLQAVVRFARDELGLRSPYLEDKLGMG